MPKQKSRKTDEVPADENAGPTSVGQSSPPPKRFKSDPPTAKGAHSVMDDTMRTQQGLAGVFQQLDMPVPDGAMDDAPATAEETDNNASVKNRLEYYLHGQAFLSRFGERYGRNAGSCEIAMDVLTCMVLPVIFDTTPAHGDAYERVIIENPWLVHKLFDAHKSGEYHRIRRLAVFSSMLSESIEPVEKISEEVILRDARWGLEEALALAYNKPFVGDHAEKFVEYLKSMDNAISAARKVVYAKAFAIVQSSGTGKSRMLTEAGNHIFTLPICLRKELSPGYPFSDSEVVTYFNRVTKDNDLSYSAHIAAACFIAAAHTTMRLWLEDAQEKNEGNLHAYWHGIMEGRERQDRRRFFSSVIKLAYDLKHQHTKPQTRLSPLRTMTVDVEQQSKDINKFAADTYAAIIQNATKRLLTFLSSIEPDALCVTYLDEAQQLQLCYWIFLRLLHSQDPQQRMWYIFMGTKSRISYYAPSRNDMLSLRMKEEMSHLLPPYVTLGFDQHSITSGPTTVTMGELQSIVHLSKYGRPLWNALMTQSEDPEIIERDSFRMIELAGIKLRNAEEFSPNNKHHVFAIFSQRLCLESVFSSPEAIELADRSISSHMRLLTQFSRNGPFFHTYSPSEPMLALGGAHVLYELGTLDHLPSSLEALSRDLFSAGLVDKGIMGELAARTLLLVARDVTAPIRDRRRDLLKPVRLLEFLVTLFGNTQWAGEYQSSFDTAFAQAYINFTHWIVTEDPMPEKPDPNILANHWARGAAIQCCFTQKAIDFIIPVYHGRVDTDAVFDRSNLTGIVGQVKFKASGDLQAETVIRPFGIPRDRSHPLPYIALLMELGCESDYQGCPQGCLNKKIKPTTFRSTNDGAFSRLKINLAHAEANHESLVLWLQILENQVGANREEYKQRLKYMKTAVKDAKQVVDSYNHEFDSYNRYSISVRGASPDVYQILKEAKIAKEFALLLRTTTVSSPELGYQEVMRQYMFPSKRLGTASNHIAWWSDYLMPGEGTEMEVD